MKREAATHPKLAELEDAFADLGQVHPKILAVGSLEALWHFAGRHAPRGDVGRFSDRAIARACGWESDPTEFITALVEPASGSTSGWLDRDDDHRLVIHDWHDHADDAVHRSVARRVELFACGCMPRLTRLGSREKEEIVRRYEERYGVDRVAEWRVQPHGLCPACAHNAPSGHLPGVPPRPAPPEPRPAPPQDTEGRPASPDSARPDPGDGASPRKNGAGPEPGLARAWDLGREAARLYKPDGPERWKLTQARRKRLAHLMGQARDRGPDAFAQVIHGYMARHRHHGADFDPLGSLLPDTMLRPGKVQERLEAYDEALGSRGPPPWPPEGARGFATKTERRREAVREAHEMLRQRP